MYRNLINPENSPAGLTLSSPIASSFRQLIIQTCLKLVIPILLLCISGCSPTSQKDSYIPLNLIVPPESASDSSITLLWDKPLESEGIVNYQVYQDGARVDTVAKTFYTATGLTPGTGYSFQVKARLGNGKLSPAGNKITHSTKQTGEIFDILSYGASGDGISKNTSAIQKSIKECTPGGTVYIPAGTFVTGPLFLKSDMTLYIAKGGILKGSPDLEDYYPFILNRYSGWEMETFPSLINAGKLASDGSFNVTNLSIRGEGVIYGGGAALGKAMWDTEGYYSRGRLICLMNCRDVNIQGLRLENSPSWTLHYIYCKNLTMHDLSIISEGIPNGDGIDPDSSTDSYIINCYFANSDDCIAVKSGKNPEGYYLAKPTENMLVAYCHFEEGHGLSIGSEMSGGVSNIVIRDCELSEKIRHGLQVKAPAERGGYVRNIVVKDCKINVIRIVNKLSYNVSYDPAPVLPFLGDMEFSNLDMEYGDIKRPVILADGFEGIENYISDVRFKNIILPDNSTISLNNCKDFSFENVKTRGGLKPDFRLTNVSQISTEKGF